MLTYMIKRIGRKTIRFFLQSKENETILDSIDRNKKTFFEKITRKKYNSSDLKNLLIDIGIKRGDVLFVHSSLRAFFEFQDIDEVVIIDTLKEVVGEEGTILMPSYGMNIASFDVKKTPSYAGSISNFFIKDSKVRRSLNSYFSVSCWSENTNEFIKDHINSLNPFDTHSPFDMFLKKGGKILTLGIGKYPYKVTFIHYIVYYLRKTPNYLNVFNKTIETEIIGYDGEKYQKKLLVRNERCQNNNRNIKKLMKDVKHQTRKLGFLDIYTCSSKDLLMESIKKNQEGISFYKIRRR